MYIAALTNIKTILINPSHDPLNTNINKKLNENIKELFKDYNNIIKNSIDVLEYTYNLVILGLDDEVLDNRTFINKYINYCDVIIVDKYLKHKVQIDKYVNILKNTLI